MLTLLPLVGLALIIFVSSNLDDIFLLIGFFADRRFRSREIVVGQYLGIGILYGACVLGSLVSLVLPPMWTGLLGLLPLLLGIKKLLELLRHEADTDTEEDHGTPSVTSGTWSRALQVALVTMANGGDNVGIYTPLFATRGAYDIAVIGLVFAVMTGVWCLLARWLVHHRTLGLPLRRYGHWLTPVVLILLGLSILYEADSIKLLQG